MQKLNRNEPEYFQRIQSVKEETKRQMLEHGSQLVSDQIGHFSASEVGAGGGCFSSAP